MNLFINLKSFFDFFSNIKSYLSDPKFKYIIMYLFVTLFSLVIFTKPKFAYDPFKMSPDIGGWPEIYFYVGYILIYIILIIIAIYNRIDRCILEYRKKDPNTYANYSAWDFLKNPKIREDAYNKTIYTIIKPFIIFLIITVVYLVVNNLSKVAKFLIVVTSIINIGMAIIVPLINIVLFILYFIPLDSNIPC